MPRLSKPPWYPVLVYWLPPVRVGQQPRRRVASGERHVAGCRDERLIAVRIPGPAAGPPRIDGEQRGQREPAAAWGDAGDVRHPLAVRSGRREVTGQQMGCDGLRRLAIRRARLARSHAVGAASLGVHEASHSLATTADTGGAPRGVNARTARDPAAGDKRRADPRAQGRGDLRMGAGHALAPGVLAAHRDGQRGALHAPRELGSMGGHEGVLQGWPREKIATAFFTLARSCLSSSSSRRRRRFSSSSSL